MGLLTVEMQEMIAATRLCFAATVNPDGTPNLSPKATLIALDGARLAFANIASPNTVRNLRQNPGIEINIVDIFRRRGYRFRGQAELVGPEGAEYELVSEKVWGAVGTDYPVHDVVVIAVVEATPVLSPAYTFGGAEEGVLREEWLANYGVQAIAGDRQ